MRHFQSDGIAGERIRYYVFSMRDIDERGVRTVRAELAVELIMSIRGENISG